MSPYRGRFAPSPTGPLHFGSLVAAVGSYLDAKSHGGAWLVRMDDLDAPRVQPGAAEGILRTLEACGLLWDEAVLYQSGRGAAYGAALAQLEAQAAVYPCGCSRKEIADSRQSFVPNSGAAAPPLPGTGVKQPAGEIRAEGAPIYPGTCRSGLAPGKAARALRVRVDAAVLAFEDRLQGSLRQDLAAEVGDFVLRRADGLYAYQLAVVVDDAAQRITDVVRGADLLDSTPRQIYLQRLLGLPTPRYLHLPAAVNAAGEKLSKQTLAPAVDARHPVAALVQVMGFLGQMPPADLARAPLGEFWAWALAHWDAARIARRRSLPAP